MNSYFVMLKTQKGWFVPLMTNGECPELIAFPTVVEAEAVALSTTFGCAFGFSVFDAEGPVLTR